MASSHAQTRAVMHPIRCFALALGLTLLVAGRAVAAEADAKSPFADLTTNPLITAMRLSPDGKWIAGIGGTSGSKVFLVDADNLRATSVKVSGMPFGRTPGRNPINVNWIAHDLLAVDYDNEVSYSVDLTGRVVARLGERFIRRMPEKGASTAIVLAYRDLEDRDIDLVDARTGDRSKFRFDVPGKPLAWAFDQSGALRALTMMNTSFMAEQTRVSNWYRADERSPWQLLEETSINDDYWVPVRALPEPDALAVFSRRGRNTLAVVRYDTATRQHVEVMAGHPNEDILSFRGLDTPTFESVITAGLKPQVFWFDPRWATVQAAVDAAVPDRINLLHGDVRGRVLVSSFGGSDPGRWFLLDTTSWKLREVAEANPKIDPQRLRPVATVTYRARDGLAIPAYVTQPAGASGHPAPMVVLIHGGPNLRDHWAFDAEVQVLARAGYVVFQPQFRGSSGFGRTFEEAGYRQWGRAMQDDITDGVQWLVSQGIADPQRVCIYGASYGGYAALWGAVKTPQLYRCAVSFAGVSDLVAMLDHSIFDDSTPVSREIQRARIGDPETMREQLDAVSPLKHAVRVGVPVFIAHGERDVRVLASQSKKMAAMLKELSKPVESMWFDNEGHGFYWLANQDRYFKALLKFLDSHIGSAAAGTPAATQPPAAQPSTAGLSQ